MTYQHWKIKKQDEIIWAYMDRAERSVNTLNVELLKELDHLLDEVAADKTCKGLIIASAKKASFVMGADIDQFTKVTNYEEAYSFIKSVHAIYEKLAKIKVPTVAVIHGFCLGGGLELALACQYRVVEESSATKLGFPEVMLGIFPGWGGTVRSPGIAGGINAMDLILSGRMLDGKKALLMGLADVAVPERYLEDAAIKIILTKPKKRKLSFMARFSNTWLMRLWLNGVMKKKIAAKAPNPAQYPAPYAALAHWVRFGASRSAKAYDYEAKAVAHLIVNKTAQNLIRIFFLQDRMKKMAKISEFKAKHVHVIGAGTMGGDIAAWCALQGMTVTLQDREAKYISPAIKRAMDYFKKKLKKPLEIQAVMDRLIPDVEGKGAAKADVIIEAIFENLAAKQKLFQDLEDKIQPHTIFASNTSSIPLEEISSVLKNPDRLVGIHFFNPVAMMPLVEVVYTQKTSDEIKNNAIAFVGQLKKQPVPVKSSPGFLVNRCLMPYLIEAVNLLDEGASAFAIDKAAKAFGMPMGPIELADVVGLDICLHVAENLSQYYGGSVPPRLKVLVESGKLGKKSGEGFYKFKQGKPLKHQESSKISQEEITQRLILRMVNESAACLREGIVQDKDLLDAGMIFGTGFAPFLGGPIHYAENEGKQIIIDRLNYYQQMCGERFKPDAYWLM
jgi:3-hydroxyacyl-CoA dehydrogenase/enoyl-CoA hydratase/3-hydroxybutyryl-CoA epimerase